MPSVFKTILSLLCFATAAFADPAPAYRDLACRVVDESGQPVRGVPVRLCGQDRDALDFDDDFQLERKRAWNFTSDAEGRFTARFGQFHADPHEQATGLNEPGYGQFHLVAIKPGYAGGVSREILNLDEARIAESPNGLQDSDSVPSENSEWQRAEFKTLVLGDPREPSPLVIVLKRGLTLHGRTLNIAGRPVRGVEVHLSLDLHKYSHTGAGGEIFEQRTISDRKGRFLFRHVYPNVFTLSVPRSTPNAPDWIRTRLRGRWLDRAQRRVTPRRGDADKPSSYERAIDVHLICTRTLDSV